MLGECLLGDFGEYPASVSGANGLGSPELPGCDVSASAA